MGRAYCKNSAIAPPPIAPQYCIINHFLIALKTTDKTDMTTSTITFWVFSDSLTTLKDECKDFVRSQPTTPRHPTAERLSRYSRVTCGGLWATLAGFSNRTNPSCSKWRSVVNASKTLRWRIKMKLTASQSE